MEKPSSSGVAKKPAGKAALPANALRSAAGETWVDSTMTEWDPNVIFNFNLTGLSNLLWRFR